MYGYNVAVTSSYSYLTDVPLLANAPSLSIFAYCVIPVALNSLQWSSSSTSIVWPPQRFIFIEYNGVQIC